MREDILIVDGYNVIFAWPELKKISKIHWSMPGVVLSICCRITASIKDIGLYWFLTVNMPIPAVPKSL